MKTVVRNHLAQPVELHLASRTVVLAPYGHAELDETEAASEHVRHLARAGQLTLHAVKSPENRSASPERHQAETRKGRKT
jgi:hypothetical protein